MTGGAGSERITFLHLPLSNVKKRMAVVAPTDIAAVNASVITLNKFFRFKPNATVDDLARENNVVRQLDVIQPTKHEHVTKQETVTNRGSP